MDVVERLRSAVAGGLADEAGDPVVLALRPGVDDAGIAAVQAGYPVPLPAELVRLLRVTGGVDGLLDLDLTGGSHDVELPELLPAGHPVAADGAGNFWLLDLTPDTTEVAPVFFFCRDAPVLLYQAPDLATFLDEALRTHEPPHTSLVADVREDRLHDVWGSRPGALSFRAAMADGDQALRDFAGPLGSAWTFVDLRHRAVGEGVAWGRFGPRTRLARHGWERIFAYAPYEKPPSRWRGVGFASLRRAVR
ncbi:MAG: SMI1/KNR4 family protein [Sporichthyaceae bacterium]